MLGRLLTLAILIGAAYWYWSGPYQDQRHPGYDKKLEENIQKMRECIRGKNYNVGATGIGHGDPEKDCADKFNLRFYEGEWQLEDRAGDPG